MESHVYEQMQSCQWLQDTGKIGNLVCSQQLQRPSQLVVSRLWSRPNAQHSAGPRGDLRVASVHLQRTHHKLRWVCAHNVGHVPQRSTECRMRARAPRQRPSLLHSAPSRPPSFGRTLPTHRCSVDASAAHLDKRPAQHGRTAIHGVSRHTIAHHPRARARAARRPPVQQSSPCPFLGPFEQQAPFCKAHQHEIVHRWEAPHRGTLDRLNQRQHRRHQRSQCHCSCCVGCVWMPRSIPGKLPSAN